VKTKRSRLKMRIICPNCDAQYEVPEDVMPPEGRDVQCSNCGQTWFQVHPDYPLDEEDSDPEEKPDATVTADKEKVEVKHDTAKPKTQEAKPPFDPAPAPKAQVSDKPATRKALDPNVAEVLREEAELEARVRRNAMSERLESQPDLGLDEIDGDMSARSRDARARMAKLRGEDPALEDVEPATIRDALPASRRDLLPDIEEINSTLRSNSDRSPLTDPGQTAQIEAQEARSSRRGFTLMVLLTTLLVLAYVFAPTIAQAVPWVDPWLSAYVGIVDSWRIWLDTQVEGLLAWLDAAAVSSSQ
jgi:predicted Zn finger-like uncharacterized protein